MKPFYSALVFFVSLTAFSSATIAGDVCDTACDLTITFPNGGTLTATEALAFDFANGGVISLGDTGTINAAVQPALLEFPEGGALTLNVGESIIFDVGGFVNTAISGNLSFTALEVTTDVHIDISLGETEVATLYDITVTGLGEILISSDGHIAFNSLDAEGSVIINSGGVIGDGNGAIGDICPPTGDSVTIGSAGTVDSGCSGTIEIGGGTDGGVIEGGGIIIVPNQNPDPIIVINLDTVLPVIRLNGTQGEVINLNEGEMYVEDGASCTDSIAILGVIDINIDADAALIPPANFSSLADLVVTIHGDVIPNPVTLTGEPYVVTYDCVKFSAIEAIQLTRTINVIFSAEFNVGLLNDAVNSAVDELNAAQPKGRKGLINKLVGNSGVAIQVEAAVNAYYGDDINLDGYLSALDAALEKIGDFDNQLAAKIKNGQIVDPASSAILAASAEINGLIFKLIDNAE